MKESKERKAYKLAKAREYYKRDHPESQPALKEKMAEVKRLCRDYAYGHYTKKDFLERMFEVIE